MPTPTITQYFAEDHDRLDDILNTFRTEKYRNYEQRTRTQGQDVPNVEDLKKGNTVLVTTHGRPTAMLVPVTEDDIEDALLGHSSQLREKIVVGLRDIRAGRTMPLSEYVKRRTTRSQALVTFQVFLAERAQTDLDELPSKVAG